MIIAMKSAAPAMPSNHTVNWILPGTFIVGRYEMGRARNCAWLQIESNAALRSSISGSERPLKINSNDDLPNSPCQNIPCPIHRFDVVHPNCRYPGRLSQMKTIRKLSALGLLAGVMSAFGGPATFEPQPSLIPADENSHDLFYYETTYTFDSDFKESKLGHGDSLYNDFSYDHRFLITGKWYFRAGVEYERYDFGGSDNGLPDHLQAASAHLALEYVSHDFPGISLELDPGVYFQDNVTGDAFDIPITAYT